MNRVEHISKILRHLFFIPSDVIANPPVKIPADTGAMCFCLAEKQPTSFVWLKTKENSKFF